MPSENETEKDFPLMHHHPVDSEELLSMTALSRPFLQFIFRTDEKGILIQNEKAFLEYLGYSEKTNEPLSLFSILHPADNLYLKTIFEEVFKTRLIQNVHFRLKDNQNSWHFFSANSRVANEAPLQFDFLVQDITEERTEKQNLVFAIRKYEQLIEKSRDTIFQADISAQKLTYISPAIVHFTGYEPAELEKISLKELVEIFIHPDDKERLQKEYAAALETSKEYFTQRNSCTFRIRHRNGPVFRIDCQYFPVRNSQSQSVTIQGYLHDITQTEQLKYVLDESQENYRNLVENTQSLFAILDRHGNFKFASGQWKDVLGYYPEDLVQNSILKLIHEEDQETVLRIIEKLAQESGNYTGAKYRLVTGNGKISWQLANLASQVSKKNKIEKIYFISNDITRLEQAKQALSYRLEYEKMLSRISNDALAVSDSRQFIGASLNQLAAGTHVDRIYLYINLNDGKRARLEYEWVSDACHSLAGKVIDYATFIPWKNKLEANAEIYFSGESAALKKLVDNGFTSESDTRAILLVPLSIQHRFYGFLGLESCKSEREWLPEDIDLIRMAAHIFEIRLEKDIEATHRQLVEQQLFESEKKYRQIVKEVPTGILHLSTSGSILDANPYILNIFELQNANDLHQVQIEGNSSESEKGDLISYIIGQVLRENLLKKHEIRTHRNDGKPIILQVSASIQRDSASSSIINAVLEDVTEHRSLELQLLQAQKMESIGMLAGGIAHDFNNLLGGIIGYASLILNEITPETNSLYWDIESILNISKRAAELTNQLMTFSRSNRFQTKPCQVNWVIDEVVTLLSRTIDKGIEIKKITEDDLYLVMADAGQLQQGILNICINARDAISEKGVIQIITKNVTLGSDFVESHLNAVAGPHVLISIVDNGCGMDDKTQSRIFEPFFTTKERTGGTGLGLALTYGIINHHQGHLNVKSKPGKGTQFDIYLPAAEEGSDLVAESSTAKTHGGVETILVIDDEEIIRNISKRILERVGYNVLTAASGADAIKLYRKKYKEVDLVLLDLVMPKMNGVEVFNSLVQINPELKVLVSSGYAEDDFVQDLKNKGVDHFIQKPFQPDELLWEIRNCLEDIE